MFDLFRSLPGHLIALGALLQEGEGWWRSLRQTRLNRSQVGRMNSMGVTNPTGMNTTIQYRLLAITHDEGC